MVAPLRRARLDGTPYSRRPNVEAALVDLVVLPESDVADRCKIVDTAHAEYLPSECLLHLVRASRADDSDVHFTALFRTLRRRILALLPRLVVGRLPDGRLLESHTKTVIADAVMDRFQELLLLDRDGYEDRLDYFEINFDDAVAKLRLTARKKAWKEENRSKPMTEDEAGELEAEIEEAAADAAAAQNPPMDSRIDDPGYRFRINVAIDALPEDQRRVVELLRRGFPIDSKEPGVQTIVGILKCAEKTVRNRRDKAFEVVRKVLEEEES
ncbi:MAG TPA: hypothetical protein VN634_19710 [Candidatus Limnocylindrales bacterium]|nr:hypothetical protein [Candidatus Limnocylindrales bacterium]